MFSTIFDDAESITRSLQVNPSPAAAHTQVSTTDMIFTLWINMILFIVVMLVFEFSRRIKQVFLKRYQTRFVVADRVPPPPPTHILGWLISTFQVSEEDVYKMVGLDGYVLLRYHVVCIKYCTLMSIFGLLILIPVNVSASPFNGEQWDRYTVLNILSDSSKSRLWVIVFFAYVYSAYFCHLLYKEYYHFALRRLDYLIQKDVRPDLRDHTDPDTPLQTYFTVMVERIPSHLRSAKALRDYFDQLFPGEVHSVEVAVDLGELSSLVKNRKSVRNSLEKAIAKYNVTGRRGTVFVNTYNEASYFFGYENVDAIAYYTFMLRTYNKQVAIMQERFLLNAQTIDSNTQKKLANKLDTRAAWILDHLSKAVSDTDGILFAASPPKGAVKRKKASKAVIDIKDNRDELVVKDISEKTQPIKESNQNSGDSQSVAEPTVGDGSSVAASQKPNKKDLWGVAQEKLIKNKDQTEKITIFGVEISKEQLKEQGKEQAAILAKEVVNQAGKAGRGAMQGMVELERHLEMLIFGAYYKNSSTAFVTFNSRVTKIFAQRLPLSDDGMEIKGAPNPHQLVWDNVSIPRSQIDMRSTVSNIAVAVGSLFWSTIVSSIHYFAQFKSLNIQQQNFLSVVILLALILMLPFVFDFLARYYEGMKLEAEIQNSIMFRYFYYQVVNVYVTVGCAGIEITSQIKQILSQPRKLVELVGVRIPSVSLFFCNLVILKIFMAVPLEMLRPPVLFGLLGLGAVVDKRTSTRREFRTGAFDEYPMLYGWVYPQLLFVLMIMQVYSIIAPLLMPFGIIFFFFSYYMYKYQLLYVYVNNYQCGGDMWYDVFRRSLIGLIFALMTLLGYLLMEIDILLGPFVCTVPLPFCIYYFYRYTEGKFRTKTQSLTLDFAKRIDNRNKELKDQNRPVPHDSFLTKTFRQPELWEPPLYPEPHRRDEKTKEGRDPESQERRPRMVSMSINPLLEVDDVLEGDDELMKYFDGVVEKMAEKHKLPRSLIDKMDRITENLKTPAETLASNLPSQQQSTTRLMSVAQNVLSTFNPIHATTTDLAHIPSSDLTMETSEIAGLSASVAPEVLDNPIDPELDEFQLFSRKKLDFAADDARERANTMTPIFIDASVAYDAGIVTSNEGSGVISHQTDNSFYISTSVPFVQGTDHGQQEAIDGDVDDAGILKEDEEKKILIDENV